MPAHRKKPNDKGEWKCSKCKKWLPASAFNKDKSQHFGLSYACRDCLRPITRKFNLKSKYNLEVEEYNALLDKSQGRCQCCNKTLEPDSPSPNNRPVIDHCHTTGRVRGILCNHCNRLVGYLGEDSAYALQLVEYINTACSANK